MMDPLGRPSAHPDGWLVEWSALLTTCYDDTNGFFLYSIHYTNRNSPYLHAKRNWEEREKSISSLIFGGVLSLSLLLYYLLEFICFNCTCFSHFLWCSRVGLFFFLVIFCAWLLFSSQNPYASFITFLTLIITNPFFLKGYIFLVLFHRSSI